MLNFGSDWMSGPFFFIRYDMSNEFEKKVAEFVRANESLASAPRILLAVSGGADSMALMYAMVALKQQGVLTAGLFCAHINHQLRDAAADADENFVVEQAGKLSLPVTVKRIDVKTFAGENKLSIETAARQLRIAALIDIAKANDISWIATAHHADDNAETVLQRLTRGTGFRGLVGIQPVTNFQRQFNFVRPLIHLRRSDIVEYLKQQNLKWCTDHTNEDVSYRRNYIRHKLLPALQGECKDNLVEMLSDLSDSARGFHKVICRVTDSVWSKIADCRDGIVSLDLKLFSSQPQPIRVEMILRSLTLLGSGQRDLTQQHFEMVLDLAEKNISGKKIELPSGFTASRQYDKLIFTAPAEKKERSKQLAEGITLELPGQTRFDDYCVEATVFQAQMADFDKFKADKSSFVEWFDLEKVKLPISVRMRRNGDRFIPLGLTESKKIGQFLTDEKVLQKIRENVLVVEDSEKIIWVWPTRMSQQVKVTDQTRNVLQLRMTGSD